MPVYTLKKKKKKHFVSKYLREDVGVVYENIYHYKKNVKRQRRILLYYHI